MESPFREMYICLILSEKRKKMGLCVFLAGQKYREQNLKLLIDKKNVVFLQNWKKITMFDV